MEIRNRGESVAQAIVSQKQPRRSRVNDFDERKKMGEVARSFIFPRFLGSLVAFVNSIFLSSYSLAKESRRGRHSLIPPPPPPPLDNYNISRSRLIFVLRQPSSSLLCFSSFPPARIILQTVFLLRHHPKIIVDRTPTWKIPAESLESREKERTAKSAASIRSPFERAERFPFVRENVNVST